MYEYILPAGAPGPGGYASPVISFYLSLFFFSLTKVKDILKHRRSRPTAFAVHPAGHFFAAGYVGVSVRNLEFLVISIMMSRWINRLLGGRR
jgi:hypothetical protein